MRIPNTIKIILLAGLPIVILVLAYYYAGYGREKRAQLSLVSPQPRMQTSLPTPSTSIAITTTPNPISTANPEIDTSNWKIFRDEENGYEYRYPKDIDVINNNGDIRIYVAVDDTTGYTDLPSKCPTMNFDGFVNEKGQPAEFEGEKITTNNYSYCKYETSEGAAGAEQKDFKYTTVKNKKFYTIFFEIELYSCTNRCETDDCEKDPAVISCEKSNEEKNTVIKKILSTFKFFK